jgi:hypothetical protein
MKFQEEIKTSFNGKIKILLDEIYIFHDKISDVDSLCDNIECK